MAKNTPDAGIETMRPVVSIHVVSESRLTVDRRADLRMRSEEDVRAHELLESAERQLWDAALRYMECGGTSSLAHANVSLAVAFHESQKQSNIPLAPANTLLETTITDG